MERVTAWRADNGQLETDPRRGKAHDIEKALQKHVSAKATGGMNSKTKVDWHVAMELLEHAEEVIEHLQEYLLLKDEQRREEISKG